jgi:competence ComEA-like helix-hairpin-helix protein
MNLRSRARIVFVLYCISFAALAGRGALAQKNPPAAPIDVNTATAAQLQQLPGVGPAMANAIVQFRKKSGPFERLEDLLAIRGITSRKLERLRPYLTLSKPAPGKPGGASPDSSK